ncbi:MAG: IS21-like element helper ATPase IstB [Candidatus Omnitrophica bacterium]|nr:IS21-like element helper ATPase IstB [Candidatus Omnitrophota bacterium]
MLNKYLKELRLPTLAKNYVEAADRARRESETYEQYLLELIEDECSHRNIKRIERWLKASRISQQKSMDSFDLKRLPAKSVQQVKILTTGTFVDNAENVLIFGNPGSGKTHLLCGIGHEIIRSGRKVYFTTCSMLVQILLRAKQQLKLTQMLHKLSKFDALIIDDIGYVQQSREEMEVLFTVLAERYERGSVLISSNLPFSKWESIFKDPMVTATAIDRLVHHSVIVELNVPSYRMDTAKNKVGIKKEVLFTDKKLSTKKEKRSKKERKATATISI